MIARVATFEGVNVEAAQRTLPEAEAIIRPLLEGLDGYRGLTELFSDQGKFISIALFDSMENARAAERTFDEELPAELGGIFQEWAGRRTSVELYQVAGEDRR